IMPIALTTEPEASAIEETSPKRINAKYSGGPKLNARRVSGTAAAAMRQVANDPATNEPMAADARAGPALPFLAISYPSMVVTAEAASPGSRNRMAVVEPPYCEP